MMRTLFQKELRASFFLALFSFCFCLWPFVSFLNMSDPFFYRKWYKIMVLFLYGFACGLGFLLSWGEEYQKTWQFLKHFPIHFGQIFWSKAWTGFLLLSVAFLLQAFWNSSPFEAQMEIFIQSLLLFLGMLLAGFLSPKWKTLRIFYFFGTMALLHLAAISKSFQFSVGLYSLLFLLHLETIWALFFSKRSVSVAFILLTTLAFQQLWLLFSLISLDLISLFFGFKFLSLAQTKLGETLVLNIHPCFFLLPGVNFFSVGFVSWYNAITKVFLPYLDPIFLFGNFLFWNGKLLLCSVGAYFFLRYRYCTRKERVAWCFFVYAGGIPALLALISIFWEEKRLRCISCETLYSPAYPQCPQCLQSWPLPNKREIDLLEV